MATDDFLNEMEDDMRRSEIGCTVSMFLIFLQQKNIWACSMKLGECPVPITSEALLELRDEFKNLSVPQPAGRIDDYSARMADTASADTN